MGALTPKEYLQKHDMLVVAPALSISTDTLDSALQQKQSQIVTVIKQYSWKMVFAKSDTVYASLFKEMTEKAKGLGYADVVKFYVGKAEKQFAARKNAK